MGLSDYIKNRIGVLDGAVGTFIQQYKLVENDFRGERFRNVSQQLSGNFDVLNLTCPHIVEDIHRRYLRAGADMITTNTFGSQRVRQLCFGLETESDEMAYEGARIARHVAEEFSTMSHPRWVCGSIGPVRMQGDRRKTDFRHELMEVYAQQTGALIEGGVDTILIETIVDVENAKVAIEAAMNVMERKHKNVPIMLSATLDNASGKTLHGQSIDDFLQLAYEYPVFSIGFNCSFGGKDMKRNLKQLAEQSPCCISACPSAGMPDATGTYRLRPHDWAMAIADFASEGMVNMVGGCCGTDDSFISLLPPITRGKSPFVPVGATSGEQIARL
ncbi:MAG: homocysteine S-methyltransferase family protein [Prevotellaceae bacterium]|nr:homocysteine S-methyltransferase family protein [Prevotellaceae bacterium]